MHVDEAIKSRFSARRFLPTPIARETVEHILAISGRAPSGHNVQPWKVYVTAGEAKDKLCAEIMEAAVKGIDQDQQEYEYYPLEWHEPYISRRRAVGYALYEKLAIAREDKQARIDQLNRNYLFFDAPVGMFVTLDRRMNTGSWMDLGMFIENILLSARGQGLHTCAQAAFIWAHGIVRRHLDLSDNEILACGIALGHLDEKAPENSLYTDRLPVSEIAKFYGFDA